MINSCGCDTSGGLSKFNGFAGELPQTQETLGSVVDLLGGSYSYTDLAGYVDAWLNRQDPTARAALIKSIPDSTILDTQDLNPTANLVQIAMSLVFGMLTYGGHVRQYNLYINTPGGGYSLTRDGINKLFYEFCQDVVKQKRLSQVQVADTLVSIRDVAILSSFSNANFTLAEIAGAYFSAYFDYGNPTQKPDLYEKILPDTTGGGSLIQAARAKLAQIAAQQSGLSGLGWNVSAVLERQAAAAAASFYRLKPDILIALVERFEYQNGRQAAAAVTLSHSLTTTPAQAELLAQQAQSALQHAQSALQQTQQAELLAQQAQQMTELQQQLQAQQQTAVAIQAVPVATSDQTQEKSNLGLLLALGLGVLALSR